MMAHDISNEDYISVLESEVEILSMNYYKPEQEGTGHYNTAISVLEHRIDQLKGLSNA
jgi:hypothetical protein